MAIDPESLLKGLFTNITNPTNNNVVGKGSVITFNYTGQRGKPIHDGYPLCIVTDIFTEMIRGVNLHYLTVPYMRWLIQTGGGNRAFSYKMIMGDKFITDSFRSYKRSGIYNIKILDVAFLKKLLILSRTLNIGEVDQMKQQIRMRLEQEVNRQPVAGEEV